MVEIAIVDYGVGNIHSIQRGLENAGAKVLVTHKPKELKSADGIVLPGVGAFKSAMDSLGESAEIIKDAASEDKPILGVCLGAQLFADWSEEGGKTEGLSLIPGKIVKLPKSVKIPHMGWNSIEKKQDHPFLSKIKTGDHVYFVHSYYYEPRKNKAILATSNYGIEFPGIIGKDSIVGTQFHPEKSGPVGLQMLKNFVQMSK
ncbi:hypothetical protein AKJ42_03220 [candidate division MSBL1 archaeon SCGC-AAA261C02]|uniref:Imidazole glycerol phosphate synthase subunit HisH n=1 Tax=candidate division MSBL1 archaeon SCGC-AAA261C02 TaxID=1698272 RepID=A0A133UZ30_9EURY|nr:hypothetical protein AKJ42_03220 [candidate division MSBL1 archaeon SCGC-AAA261C02]